MSDQQTINCNAKSIEEFQKTFSLNNEQPALGNPYEWLNWICERSDKKLLKKALDQISEKPISREDIYKMVKEGVDTVTCVSSILSWGGMRRTNGLTAFSMIETWSPICDKIREKKFSRASAYEEFNSIRLRGEMKGMGPAFFTKLIFFLMHDQENQGYIMDQWTAASVNLIYNTDLVKLRKIKNKNSYFEIVNDKNSSEDYENFCRHIEFIAKRFDKSPVDIELAMFSEGRGNGKWREYVVQSRNK